ncbi:uncharacterized protein KY384_004421 [Bacidia gigantensis]|uniref:uncharacterized protein n=1 Tax=Bacidia gigantensis TaxID=2732470 RepID=UPI001D044E85|nr:uncharacterized protein KY384_004421 [Bacidia gigantensis]KAG8531064.1 hypothetical protein KY384_004421 [Bacidia gigantensis]
MRVPISPQILQNSIRKPLNFGKLATIQFPQSFSSIPVLKMSAPVSDFNLENTNVKTASGVTLDETQHTLVASVLDLFAGRPSLKKLQLWDDNGTFADNITRAVGRKQYEAQWYGLQAAFSEIERLHHEVTSAGNPISMDLRTRYVIKGLKKEQTIDSKINIFYDKETQKITKVEDKWGGKLPDSSFSDAMRKLNAVSVPLGVSVPKTDEEDAKRGNQ